MVSLFTLYCLFMLLGNSNYDRYTAACFVQAKPTFRATVDLMECPSTVNSTMEHVRPKFINNIILYRPGLHVSVLQFANLFK